MESARLAAVSSPAHRTPSRGSGSSGERFIDYDPNPLDPVAAAQSAGLRYVSDEEPGIRRRRRAKSFSYVAPDGSSIVDEKVLARIAKLAIPPAWSDVWICSRGNGHLQATGRDDRGRKQYRYHPQWRAVRDETKYGRMLEFGLALPRIRSHVTSDLARPGLSREKVLAVVVTLLQETLIRVGNEEYARSNGSRGLTTMRDRNVDIAGSTVTFLFRGKSGRQHEIGVRDRKLAGLVSRCRDLPGQTLFQYVDDYGDAHPIGSTDVNAYLRAVTGSDFTAKDFRTWYGTVLAATELAGDEPSLTERERTHRIVQAIAVVAERLGNTPAICRKCYVHPLILEAFADGRLHELAVELRDHSGRGDYSSDEQLVLQLLEIEAANNR